jgi:hypothetical protein
MSNRVSIKSFFTAMASTSKRCTGLGSFEETRALAGKIARKGGAEFRIFKLGNGAEAYFEDTQLGINGKKKV